MLTPKCPRRDFRASARENATKNRLHRLRWNLRGLNLAGIREEFASLAKPRKFFYINHLVWLCSQSRANPSLPAISGNAGRFCQIAGISPSCLRRKPPRFNALQAFSLVRGAGRTIVDSRECLAQFMGHLLASIANKDCPLCPRKQTCSTSKSMSAKCHKRKSVVPSDSAKRSLECRSRPHGQ
jgi:hypothetical protein